MANLGAEVKGVDISPADDKDSIIYTHITSNLVAKLKTDSTLSTLVAPNTVNVVNTNMLTQLKPVSASLREALEHENITLEWFDINLGAAIMTMLMDGGVWVNDLETKIK